MKASWFTRCALAVFVSTLSGCPEQLDEVAPDDKGPTAADAASSIDPVATTEPGSDAGAVDVDASVAPAANDAAATHEEVDASAPDAGSPADGGSTDDASAADAGEPVDACDASTAQGDAGDPSPPSFADVYALISASCIGCHGAGKTLDLSTPELALAGLVDVPAQYSACASDPAPTRVVPGDPAASLLISKLEGTQSCGKQMPPKALLELAQIDVFRAWVAAGAHAL